MELTTKQEQLIDDLRNHLMELNEKKSSNTGFNFLDLNEIKSEEEEDMQQFNEIELHNQAMNENQMNYLFDVIDKLDADFKKAGLRLRCYTNKKDALRLKKPMSIFIEAFDENGKRINSTDLIWLEAKPKYVRCEFKGRHIYKIVEYKYGRIHENRLIYNTVEEYMNSPEVKQQFAIMYRNQCK